MKRLILSNIYRCGALDAWHAGRNRSTLTVVLFHRVLPIDTRRPRKDWPRWTVTPDFFEQCLRFFGDHYRFVAFSDILDALSGRTPLPPRAILVTFDDGWRDTVDVAAPILRRLGIPCLLFAVGRLGDGAELWQEPVVRAWLDGLVDTRQWLNLWRTALPHQPSPTTWSFQDLQRLLAALDALLPERRASLLQPFNLAPPCPNAMADAGLLRSFAQPPLEVGAHGLSHLPLTLAPDPFHELTESRRRIESILQRPADSLACMSWPHGQYSPGLVETAFSVGYKCLFTSDAILNQTRGGIPSSVLGRFEPDMCYCADEMGRLMPEVLASLLFRLPRQRLTGSA